MIVNTGVDQLLDIELGRVDGAEIGADCLPLHGQLDRLVRDIFAHRRVKFVGLAASACRRTAAAVEKYDRNAVLL